MAPVKKSKNFKTSKNNNNIQNAKKNLRKTKKIQGNTNMVPVKKLQKHLKTY